MKRLETHSGLDLKSLDVTTTSVSFDKNMAYATVAFHPKDSKSVNSGMVMKYTLENRDGEWTVVNVGDLHGNGFHNGIPGTLPPGHPQTDTLPPGHPALGDQAGSEGRSQ
ncbi:MAG: hypothetical protein JO061_17075 [Acidobacteriaceae bacterium]|nr:hypothetical protein [Acidobacteriaceae bacterium]